MQVISRIVSSCKTETLYPLNSNSPFSPPSSSWQLPFYFLFIWAWLLYIPYISKWNYTACLFCDWFILLSIMSSYNHAAACVRISFFEGWQTFHGLDISIAHFVYPFIRKRTLRLFLPLGYCECCCNEHESENISCRSRFQCFWIPKSGIAR